MIQLKLYHLKSMAGDVGFEPTLPFDNLVFKTSAFDRSANHPN